jgi:HEAT repeat protein
MFMIRRVSVTPLALALALGLSTACATATGPVDETSTEVLLPEGDLGLLVEDLLYGSPEERLRAIDDIAGLGADGRPAAKYLIDVMQSDLPAVRVEAARALPQVSPSVDEAVPALAEALEDEDDEVVQAAAESLATFGAAAVNPLVGALKSERSLVRSSAATALGVIGTDAERATGTLLGLMGDPDAEVRSMAARTLGHVATNTTTAVQALVRALDDQDQDVRANAAWSIGEHGGKARWAVLPLVDSLRDSNPEVRAQSATALGKMGSHASQATLDLSSVLKEDGDESVRRECIEALRLIRGEEAVLGSGVRLLALENRARLTRVERLRGFRDALG